MQKILILLSVMMISACGQTIMTKPNLTQEQWQKDLAQCEYESTSSTQNVDYGYTTGFGQALDQAMRKNNLTKLCLKARGYTEQLQQQ